MLPLIQGFPADREGSSAFLPGLRSGASHCTFLWALGSDRRGEGQSALSPVRSLRRHLRSFHPSCGLALCCPVLLRRARTQFGSEAVLPGSGSLGEDAAGGPREDALPACPASSGQTLAPGLKPSPLARCCRVRPGCALASVKCIELGLRALDETNPGLCALFLVCCFYAAGQLLAGS